jgi:ankyrin repeat protein
LQYMMQSPFASTALGSPFHRGEFPESTITPDCPIFGGIEAVMELLRVLSRDSLEARDVHGQTPLYMASSLGMEGLGRGILLRLAEVPGSTNQGPLDTRDLTGQTVLGASIVGGCSLQYIRFLIESGAQVDPHELMPMPWTPLQAAALSGSLETVRLLLDNGAEIDRVFPGNDTPLTLAQQAGHADVVGILDVPATRHSGHALGLGWNPG